MQQTVYATARRGRACRPVAGPPFRAGSRRTIAAPVPCGGSRRPGAMPPGCRSCGRDLGPSPREDRADGRDSTWTRRRFGPGGPLVPFGVWPRPSALASVQGSESAPVPSRRVVPHSPRRRPDARGFGLDVARLDAGIRRPPRARSARHPGRPHPVASRRAPARQPRSSRDERGFVPRRPSHPREGRGYVPSRDRPGPPPRHALSRVRPPRGGASPAWRKQPRQRCDPAKKWPRSPILLCPDGRVVVTGARLLGPTFVDAPKHARG